MFRKAAAFELAFQQVLVVMTVLAATDAEAYTPDDLIILKR